MTSAPGFFPWLSSPAWHHLFEVLAFLVAGQIAWRRGPRNVASFGDRRRLVVVLAGAVLGALFGAKLLHALEFAPALVRTHAPLSQWLGGKSLVGGLLGAIGGVELAKLRVGIRTPTGDAFVLPLTAGIAIGRMGCFAAGLADGTHGIETLLPWGIDFGDGVTRHPTQLYEALWVLVLGVALTLWRSPSLRQSHALRAGDRFRLFVVGYLGFRFAVEFLKPPFGPPSLAEEASALLPVLYGGALTAIQIAALLGIVLYAPAAIRAIRALARGRHLAS